LEAGTTHNQYFAPSGLDVFDRQQTQGIAPRAERLAGRACNLHGWRELQTNYLHFAPSGLDAFGCQQT
jgi:hypothetical protein